MKIIAVTGMPCSGKKILRMVIEERTIPIIVMSRIVREEMVKKGQVIDNLTLREYATRLRKVYGYDAVAKKCIPHIEKYKDVGVIALDGVRGMKEVDLFKKKYGDDFILIGVHSSPKIRFNRMLKRCSPSDPQTFDEFEYRERTEFGWGLGDAISRSDLMVVNNDKSVDVLKSEFSKVLDKILDVGNKKLFGFIKR
tara:strand:- start:26795 stop:27382 length:588 start_codon:yes stop_codon:yes gene_type:complete